MRLFDLLKRIDRGAILLVNNEIGELEEIIGRSKFSSGKTIINYSRSIVDKVMKDGRPITMSDLAQKNSGSFSDSMLHMKSVMCVPLISKSRVRGVIYAHSVKVPHGFRKDDLFLLTGIATPAAVTIENALLYSKRMHAEKALKKAHDKLEERVRERTSELSMANALLKEEIGERTHVEEALRESEERYRLLVDNASEGICIVQDGVVTFTNPFMEAISGYSPQESSRIPFSEVVHPGDRDMVVERHTRRLKGEKLPNTSSYRIMSRNYQYYR